MLGRLPDPDPRDANYPMRALLTIPPTLKTRYWWAGGAWLDQGATGTCVGHGWAHWIEDGPRTWPGTVDPYAIYLAACMRDTFVGNDNGDLNYGTSVRAGAEAVVAMGRASEYRWAWDVPTIVDAILTKGPVVVGTNWYSSMMMLDEGFLEVYGGIAGGHCYVLNGVSTVKGIVRVKNSWGRGWGNKGHAYLSLEDLERLIGEDGEACMAVER